MPIDPTFRRRFGSRPAAILSGLAGGTLALSGKAAEWRAGPSIREIVVDGGPPGYKVGRLEMLKRQSRLSTRR